MKELSIEEKAKRYDKAIKKAGERYNEEYTSTLERSTLSYVFPELAESEGERIRKELIALVNAHGQGMYKEEMLAWLEKQGEQKPAVIIPKFRVGDTIRIKNSDAEYTITEISDGYYRGKGWCLDIAAGDKCGDYELIEQKPAWSEEDENHVKSILSTIECCKAQFPNAQAVVEAYNADIEWFKNLKDRVQPKPKQEWGGEDEKMIDSIIGNIKYLYSIGSCDNATVDKKVNWLKSLSPQNRWKSSETDIRIFEQIIDGIANPISYSATLHVILEQLKKLREE